MRGGLFLQQQGIISGVASFPIPTDGLVFMLDGAVAGSMYSDIAKTTVCNQSDPLAVWEDQSGNGNDWIQSNASYRPIAQPDDNRIHNLGSGAGITDHLVGPNISTWTEGTFIAHVYVNGATEGGIWGTTAWNNANSLNHWNFATVHYINFGTDQRPSSGSGTINAWLTYENNVATDGVTTVYEDAVSIYSADLGTVGFRSTPYLGGGVRSGGIQYCINAYYRRVVGYNRILTAPERIIVNGWLAS